MRLWGTSCACTHLHTLYQHTRSTMVYNRPRYRDNSALPKPPPPHTHTHKPNKEIPANATAWMNLEGIRLREISQPQQRQGLSDLTSVWDPNQPISHRRLSVNKTFSPLGIRWKGTGVNGSKVRNFEMNKTIEI